MTAKSVDLEYLVRRLELRIDRLRVVALSMSLLCALSVVTVLTSPHAVIADDKEPGEADVKEVLRARCFLLLDKEGHTIAALTRHVDTDKPILNLFAADGSTRATLCLNQEDHPLLSFLDNAKRQRARLYLNDDWAGQIDMFDSNRHANIELQAGSYPLFYMRCDSPYGRVMLHTSKNGSKLELLGEDGDNSTLVGVGDDGNPFLRMTDKTANELFRAPK